MLAIEIRFLTGRFHATTWGQHVNEGRPEWPPSPFRLLRALVSSWRRRFPDLGEGEVMGLVGRLAVPPAMRLPEVSEGHTRHYVLVKDERRLMLDAFVVVGDEPLVFVWEALSLGLEEERLLDLLLGGVSYFGRAESWCAAARVMAPGDVHARPLGFQKEGAVVRHVLCGTPGMGLEGLETLTARMRREGRVRPVGTEWVAYEVLPTADGEQAAPGSCIASFCLRGRAVPVGETLTLANQVRQALLGQGALSLGGLTPTLTGKVEGEVRRDGHRHLHVLPEGEGDHLEQVLLWAPEGFSETELAALRGLSQLPGGVEMLPWGLAGAEQASLYFGRGCVWESATPYLMARHPKSHGRDSAEEQVVRECQLRGLPSVTVTRLEAETRAFTVRRGQRATPPGEPLRFRLEFAQPVTGPLCLGFSAHFGLGRFRAVAGQESDSAK